MKPGRVSTIKVPGDGETLKGFKKEIGIALHFRKVTLGTVEGWTRQETGFKEKRVMMSPGETIGHGV